MPAPAPALDGLRVLDLSQYEAGPSCTQLLAWLGADVVKVEKPGLGDPGRNLLGATGTAAYFLYWNANKRSVAIDLEKPEGRELLLRMLPRYDVFVENFGPGVIEKLGLDYARVHALHPGLIYARIKGFGGDGPHAGYKSFDMVAQATAGAFSITGSAGRAADVPRPDDGRLGHRRAGRARDHRRLRAEAAHGRGPARRALDAGGDDLLRAHADRERLELRHRGRAARGQRRRADAEPVPVRAGRAERLRVPGDRHAAHVGSAVRGDRAPRARRGSALRGLDRAPPERRRVLRGDREVDARRAPSTRRCASWRRRACRAAR